MSSQNRESAVGGETSRQLLAKALLGESVQTFIAQRRMGDKPTSWRAISQELAQRTGGQVNVTEVTLRAWHAAAQEAAA